MTTSIKTHKEKSSVAVRHARNPPDYKARIAELAYYKAERRHFQPGHEMDDWLEAEQELLFQEKYSRILQKTASHLML